MLISKKLFICFIGLLSIVCFSSCNNTRHLAEGQVLYTGASIKLNTEGDVTAKQKKVLKNDLEGVTRPRPNSTFLGLRFKLGFWNLFRNAKEGSFFDRLRERWGEPPVLLQEVDLERNERIMAAFLENKGFFHATVSGDTIVKNKRASATYTAEAGPRYMIDSVSFPNDTSDLARYILESSENSLLQNGQPFDLGLIKTERDRIDAYLKERGFYYFSPDDILVRVDSTVGEHRVNLYVVVKPETPDEAKRIYVINDVVIYADYNLNTAQIDTSRIAMENHEGYYIVDRDNKFKPKLFLTNMQFVSGEIYNRRDHNNTLSRLINLDAFKFVRNRFATAPSADTPRLDAYYYLTPMPTKSLRAEVTGTTRSNNLTGTEITLSWRHRNIFRAAEQFRFNIYGGSEIQMGGTFRGFNTYRFGAEVNLVVPRFAIPFTDIRNQGTYSPITNFRLGYDFLNRRRLYTLNSFRAAYGFLWRKTIIRQHELYPISINYVQPFNVTDRYLEQVDTIPSLARVIERQFILGANYQYNYNQLLAGFQPINAFYLNALIDISGNIAGLITGANAKETGERIHIFRAPFAQYVKTEGDGRYYRKLGLNSTWANRLNIGVGLPYGNSLQLPYIKQFFVGGNNSVRAFRSRSIGPGSYRPEFNADFWADQTGDLKLEANTEWRPHISGPLFGAVFVDAGNIWLFNEDTTRPGAKITKRFLSELAVGTGVGIRLDIQIFVLRLDVGIPLRKPWREPGERWVVNEINFGDPGWRRDNIIFNFAIGYPF